MRFDEPREEIPSGLRVASHRVFRFRSDCTMARTRRNEVSRARRSGSARGDGQTVMPPVNDAVAASIAWIQNIGTHPGALSDIKEASLVLSSAFEVQPAVSTGCPVGGSDVHQPMCMGLQPGSTDGHDVSTLAELDATPGLESTKIGAATLQTVFPPEFGNPSSPSTHASPFQYDGALASVVLSCGAGNPASNVIDAAPTPPIPEIVPLDEAEEDQILHQLFQAEQRRSLENATSLFTSKRQNPPNHGKGPMQVVDHDPPSHAHAGLSLGPLNETTHPSTIYPDSFKFRHCPQQGPQQPLAGLAGDMQKPLLGSAPFHSSASSTPYAMEYSTGYLPCPNSDVATGSIVPNLSEAHPAVNITPFVSVGQSAATSAPPNSALIPNRSAHPTSAIHTNVAARAVPRGRVPRRRPPQSRQASVARLRSTRPAPTPGASSATMALAGDVLGRIEERRQKHIRSERKKRKIMNELYDSIRDLLPPTTTEVRPSNTTILQGMINFIDQTKRKLKVLEQQLEHSQQLVEALRNVDPSADHLDPAVARLLTNKGFTCLDNTHDPSALTAVATLPALENSTGLGSLLGTNVSISSCHDHYSLTISSPYVGCGVALFYRVVVAIEIHCLEVLCASIITTGNTYIYTLQCKGGPFAELLRNNLHSVLQGLVNNFPSSSLHQEYHG